MFNMIDVSRRASKIISLLTLVFFAFSFIGTNSQVTISTPFSFVSVKKTLSESENLKFAENYIKDQNNWADSVLNAMTLEEKVGQLFMIATYSNRNESEYAQIEQKIRKYNVGGLIFFQGDPVKQAILTNRYQKISKTPLMIGMDGEWGLGMRLDNTVSYPKAITLGALPSPDLIEEMGRDIGRQFKRLGVHINFAPVADVNTNPENPVINYRSFGESPNKVGLFAAAYARGMRTEGIMSCAKHFPGHGDTETDSHVAMPVISHNRERLNNKELLPFKVLISENIAAIMTGHLHVPALDNRPNRAATVSKKIVTDLLKKELGFTGLTITDAMNMRGVTRQYSAGGAEYAAFEAGNDIILQSGALEASFEKLLNGFRNNDLDIESLNLSVHKILKAKYWVGLNQDPTIELNNLIADLNKPGSETLKERIFQKAVTVIRSQQDMVPLVQLDTLAIGLVAVGAKPEQEFYKEMSRYSEVVNYELPFKPSSRKDWDFIVQQAATIDAMVIAVHDMNSLSSRNFGVSESTLDMIKNLATKTRVIIVGFGNPYGMRLFDDYPNVICGYENEISSYKAVAEVLYGAIASKGTLPVTVAKNAFLNQGVVSTTTGRLIEGKPQEVGMDANRLTHIDEIVQEGIAAGAFPGCQVLVARRGKVVFNKAYGTYRYGTSQKVTNETLYDLASLTKVSATLQAVMMLNERGELDLNRRASYYLPQLRGTNKEDLIMGDILFHQAGLKSFEAFWTHTKTANGSFKGEFYSFSNSVGNLQVSDNLYIKPSIKDSVLQWIIDSDFTTRKNRDGSFRYLYSDLGLILTQLVVEQITNQPLDEFLQQNLYEPLGMTSTGFNPLNRFPKDRIAPTEYDNIFRGSQIWGTVHDPNAALLGGVAGHAGLFSNAWDLAKLYQMNLQNGTYGGREYMFPNTIKHFGTNYTNKSHRGIGWNKPKDGADLSSVASTASPDTYGHTGFTGTVVWVDPDRQLIFIMLANRVYPSASNTKLMKMDIRKRIHEVINESIDLN